MQSAPRSLWRVPILPKARKLFLSLTNWLLNRSRGSTESAIRRLMLLKQSKPRNKLLMVNKLRLLSPVNQSSQLSQLNPASNLSSLQVANQHNLESHLPEGIYSTRESGGKSSSNNSNNNNSSNNRKKLRLRSRMQPPRPSHPPNRRRNALAIAAGERVVEARTSGTGTRSRWRRRCPLSRPCRRTPRCPPRICRCASVWRASCSASATPARSAWTSSTRSS